MAKNNEMPAIRFSGYTDAWEQRKLGECVDISTGYPFDSQDFNENGEYLVITNGNIQENTPFVLNNVGNRIDLDDSLKKYILDIDDLLITMDGTVGRVAIVVDNKLVLAQRVCRIKSNEPYYIYQLLSKNDFIQSMNKIGHGGTIKHISLSEISEYQAFYPKSEKERIKISTVLTNCDKLITLHQRKLEKLKLIKKALLQKLFPQNGSKFPELRFKGFTDAWEQRKLISLYKTIRNAFVGTATPYYTNDSINGYFYLESNNVKNGAINRNNEIYITKDFYEKQEDKWLYKDDIVIVQSGHVGHTAVIPEELDKTAAHALIMLQNKKENFDSHFINNSFQTPFIRNKIDEITTGNTIKHILASDVKNIVIKIPSFKEQKLISQLFKLLDLNITLHQRKLEMLKNVKKGLLQKMFV